MYSQAWARIEPETLGPSPSQARKILSRPKASIYISNSTALGLSHLNVASDWSPGTKNNNVGTKEKVEIERRFFLEISFYYEKKKIGEAAQPTDFSKKKFKNQKGLISIKRFFRHPKGILNLPTIEGGCGTVADHRTFNLGISGLKHSWRWFFARCQCSGTFYEVTDFHQRLKR